MHRHVRISEQVLRQLLERLPAGLQRLAICPAGLSRSPQRQEWLGHTLHRPPPSGPGPRILIALAAEPGLLPARLAAARAEAAADEPVACLALGTGSAAGTIAGMAVTGAEAYPIDRLTLVGPGFPEVGLTLLPAGRESAPAADLQCNRAPPIKQPPSPTLAIWSRTIGALGETPWRRLTDLRVAIVGCGRSGSVAALALVRLGVRHLFLVDPDTLEPHNLGEAAIGSLMDLGRTKVAALADHLRAQSLRDDLTLGPVPHSILALPALAAVKAADVLFSCVDNPAARLATAHLATLYLRPLFDIGTGIFHAGDPAASGRRLGADVRLVLPGRCLSCLGGVAASPEARAALVPEVAPPSSPRRAWHDERSGSLLSLNALAVHLAVRLLEDFLGGRVAGSTWLHLEFNPAGLPSIEQRRSPARPACPGCALTALGDAGLQRLPDWWSSQ